MENQESNSQAPLSIDLPTALGADGGVSVQCFTIYIPSRDRVGELIIDQRKWVMEAMRIMTEINAGSTAMPPVEGTWLNEQNQVIWDKPILVYSFINAAIFPFQLPKVREFLHRMGRETNQGEIAFSFAERFYRIRQFDPAVKE